MKQGAKILMWTTLGLFFIVAMVLSTLYLWNWLVPTLFKGPEINVWQAIGLIILSKILFSGVGKRCHCGGHYSPWKKRLHQKISCMSDEEREAFKQKMQEKWCTKSHSDDEPR